MTNQPPGPWGWTNAASLPWTGNPSGMVLRNIGSKLNDYVTAEDFGAVGDGVTDDTAALQAAINYASVYNVKLQLTRGYMITNTIYVGVIPGVTSGYLQYNRGGPIIEGTGWGSHNGNTQYGPVSTGGYIWWNAPNTITGAPMIAWDTNIGGVLRDIRLVGNSSNPPLAAIYYSTSENPVPWLPSDSITVLTTGVELDNILIGPISGYDGDANNPSLVNGIQFSSKLNVSGDSWRFGKIYIGLCSNAAIYMPNENASGGTIDVLHVFGCKYGIQTAGSFDLNYMFNGNNTGWDIYTYGEFTPTIVINTFASEGTAGMWLRGGSGSHLIIRGGGVQVNSSQLNSSGNLIEFDTVGGAVGTVLELTDFNFFPGGTFTTPWQVQCFSNTLNPANYGHETYLVRVGNIYWNNLTLGNVTAAGTTYEQRPFTYIQATSGVPGFQPDIRNQRANPNIVSEQPFQLARNDYNGKLNAFGGPLQVWPLITPLFPSATPTGTGSTTYAYKVTATTYDGETAATAEFTCVNAATLTSTVFNTLTWWGMPGASGYNVYGRTSGTETLLAQVTWESINGVPISSVNWVDNGTNTPNGVTTPPVINTTGQLHSNFLNLRAPGATANTSIVQTAGTAAPTTGTWAQGSIVWNTAPTATGTLLWVCTTAGTPGTWTGVTIP